MDKICGEVKVMKLDDQCYERYERDYGLTFQPLPNEVSSDLEKQIDEIQRQKSILQQQGEVDMPKSKAVLYILPFVLDKQLDTNQKKAINDHETSGVARYTTSIQKEIAVVPIRENFEDMVDLHSIARAWDVNVSFSGVPFHEACGEWAGRRRQFWAREGFANRLMIMGKLLNAIGVQLHFEDAFRPVGVQEGLFKRRVAWTKRDFPLWSEEQILEEAKSKTAIMARLASHKGGAAIDATLESVAGRSYSFGHEYPDGGAMVFPKSPFLTADQWKNRQLFQVAAGLSGLTLYVGEDWHLSYGDNLASLDIEGHVEPTYIAKYGPIKSFDKHGDRGVISDVYSTKEMDEIFPTK